MPSATKFEGREKTLLKVLSPCLGYGTVKVLAATCPSGVTAFPFPPPVQSGYIFERDPHRLKSKLIKDAGLLRGLESIITHSFAHQHLLSLYLGSSSVKGPKRG